MLVKRLSESIETMTYNISTLNLKTRHNSRDNDS